MGAAARQMAAHGELAQPFHQPPQAFTEAGLLANALVGDPAAVADQVAALRLALGPCPLTLMLKPATFDPATARRSLRLFAQQDMPRLARDEVAGPCG
jgi:alkanesulfonate monooxygenase SsuD/methylene tetrahydromethanopterin reductase-like flavin-dependent oxidoreductase (luciferase family)